MFFDIFPLGAQHTACVNVWRSTPWGTAQKEATRSLPRFGLQGDVLRQYAASRMWVAGLGADMGGALLMIAAFALAPVRTPSSPMLPRATACAEGFVTARFHVHVMLCSHPRLICAPHHRPSLTADPFKRRTGA